MYISYCLCFINSHHCAMLVIVIFSHFTFLSHAPPSITHLVLPPSLSHISLSHSSLSLSFLHIFIPTPSFCCSSLSLLPLYHSIFPVTPPSPYLLNPSTYLSLSTYVYKFTNLPMSTNLQT